MTESALIPPPAVEEVEDARALQLRLYREIGLSAVAAALDVSLKTVAEPIQLRQPVQSSETADLSRVAA
jgi:hypothetical protein